MQNEEMLYFKQLLREQLQSLAEKREGNNPAIWEFAPDITDRATHQELSSLTHRIREREAMLIRKIRRSLKSIEEGTFGICEACEEEIPIARLKARPVATLCIKCKQEQETAEQVTVYP